MPKEAYGIAAFAAAILGGLFLATYSGPYRWASDLQISLFHANLVTLSYLFATFLSAVPLLGICYWFERRYGERETWFTPIWNDFDHVLDRWPGKVLLVGLTLGAMGGYFGLHDLAMGPLRSLSVHEAMPDAAYVELVDGVVDEGKVIRFRNNGSTYQYTPVFSESNIPVLFLRTGERTPLRDANGKILGIIEKNALEGELQSQLQSAGLLGQSHWVLGVGRKPTPLFGAGMAGVGLLLVLVALFAWRRALRSRASA